MSQPIKTLAIIQARMGSTRLPGKVLMPIAGRLMIEHLIIRLKDSKTIDRFVIATTSNEEDDAIEHWCENNCVACVRGSDWDVLDRFWHAANAFENQPAHIARISCDSPLLTHKELDTIVAAYLNSGKDYFSNSNNAPEFIEDGFTVEMFTYAALQEAAKNAKLLSEREHVCPYIKKHFSCGYIRTNSEYTFKLSVDTQADLEIVEAIFLELRDKELFDIHDVTALLRRKPELLEINKASVSNSGYQKSLKEDKKVK